MIKQEYIDIYNRFKRDFNGKYIDIDGMYGGQCWDLAQMFFSRYLGIPEYVMGGSGLVSNLLYGSERQELNQFFEEYDPNKVVIIPGDVAIWEYGHIALVDSWDGTKILYFSQNPNSCQVMPIYAGGLHLFRRKGLIDPTPQPINLPTTHIVVPGDTVAKLCLKYYGVTDEVHWNFIKNINNLDNNYTIILGSQLTIPIYEVPKPIEEPIIEEPMILPTIEGYYLDKDNALWYLLADSSWSWKYLPNRPDRSGNEPMIEFAPFTQAPQSVIDEWLNPVKEELPPIDDNSNDEPTEDDTGGIIIPPIDNEPKKPIKIDLWTKICIFIFNLIKKFGGKK